MPLVRREGQQRIVPDHAVDAYRADGWDDGSGPSMPAESDRKDAWEDYARSQGVDPAGMTKVELIERLGG